MLGSVGAFVVESPLPTSSVGSDLMWVPVALVVAGLAWIDWKQRRTTTD
jgi:hypothetical protein